MASDLLRSSSVATRRPGGTRAKDSDRTATCQILDSAFAEGQLSMEEHRQRVSAATNAATLGELESLVADLQTAGALQPSFTTGPRAGRGPLVIAGMTVAAVVVLAAVAVVLMSAVLGHHHLEPECRGAGDPRAGR